MPTQNELLEAAAAADAEAYPLRALHRAALDAAQKARSSLDVARYAKDEARISGCEAALAPAEAVERERRAAYDAAYARVQEADGALRASEADPHAANALWQRSRDRARQMLDGRIPAFLMTDDKKTNELLKDYCLSGCDELVARWFFWEPRVRGLFSTGDREMFLRRARQAMGVAEVPRTRHA